MPLGHSYFGDVRRRRLRPDLAGWGLMAAGAGILGSSALAIHPADLAALGLLSAATGLVAWRAGGHPGLAAAVLSGLAYLLLELGRAGLATEEALRAAPAVIGLLALALAAAEMGHLVQGLVQSSLIDQVTRLPNYDLFLRFVNLEVARSMRHRLPFCLVLLEIQELDSYSRTYGYWRSDFLLRELARTMAETLRSSDVLGRLGGPQFGLLLPMAKSDGALSALQRVESSAAVLPLPIHRGSKPGRIRWNVGIAEFPADGQDAAELLRVAGARLGIVSPDPRPALPEP